MSHGGNVHELPIGMDRAFARQWGWYATAMRSQWAGVPGLEDALRRCERFVRPLFMVMAGPITLTLTETPDLQALGPQAKADVARLLEGVLEAYADQFGRRAADVVFHIANEFMLEATGVHDA